MELLRDPAYPFFQEYRRLYLSDAFATKLVDAFAEERGTHAWIFTNSLLMSNKNLKRLILQRQVLSQIVFPARGHLNGIKSLEDLACLLDDCLIRFQEELPLLMDQILDMLMLFADEGPYPDQEGILFVLQRAFDAVISRSEMIHLSLPMLKVLQKIDLLASKIKVSFPIHVNDKNRAALESLDATLLTAGPALWGGIENSLAHFKASLKTNGIITAFKRVCTVHSLIYWIGASAETRTFNPQLVEETIIQSRASHVTCIDLPCILKELTDYFINDSHTLITEVTDDGFLHSLN